MKKIIIFLVIILILVGSLYAIVKTIFPLKHDYYIELYSKEYDIDPYLVAGVIKAESNFEQTAVSSKNATGLMQITESTAKWIADKLDIDDFNYQTDITSAKNNIQMGCFYIDYLLDMYSGDTECALAAYNAGFGNVNKWLADSAYSKDGETLDVIPFPETEDYVKRVMNYQKIYNWLYKDLKD